MTNELPVIRMKVTPTAAAADDVRKFMADLENVAESCQSGASNRNANAQGPQTYLEPMAKKYSFAPPRKALYEREKPKPFVPERLIAQIKRATKTFVNSIGLCQR